MSNPFHGTLREHLDYCKARALDYVDQGDVAQAYASLTSDLGKHPETNTADYAIVLRLGMPAVLDDDAAEMRRFIEGL